MPDFAYNSEKDKGELRCGYPLLILTRQDTIKLLAVVYKALQFADIVFCNNNTVNKLFFVFAG